jgi:PAS domain S-box-containing protein
MTRPASERVATVERYVAGLRRYVGSGDDRHLAAAYDIGRAALSEGTSMMRLLADHQELLADLVAGITGPEDGVGVARATTFLNEALAPFEIAHRGYREATAVLADLSVLDHASDAILIRDVHGIVNYWNRGAEELYGYRRGEALGARLDDLVTTQLPEPPDNIQRRLERDGVWSGHVERTTRHGNQITVAMRWTARKPAGELSAILEIGTDATRQLETQRAMEEAFENERRASTRLREADEMKQAFLQGLSHELRTPLTSILGMAHTLNRSDVELGADMRKMLIERVTHNAVRLDRLLQDLLDVDRLSRNVEQVRLRDTDLHELVVRVLERFDQSTKTIEAALQPVTAPADPPKLERVVEALVHNAIRHTPDDATIRVTLGLRDGRPRLIVEDNGLGVPDELKPTVFVPFVQGEATRTDANPGTGVGLSLARHLVLLHGGRIWVQDSPQGGASFHVELRPSR